VPFWYVNSLKAPMQLNQVEPGCSLQEAGMACIPSLALRIGERNPAAELEVRDGKFEFMIIAVCDWDTEVQCQEFKIQIVVQR
jgi:hypothetical protein